MRICGCPMPTASRDAAELFAALADETRLRMLVVLQELGELCSCDLETGLEVTQSRASRHLSTLRRAGLVLDRRDGPFVYYRLAEPLPEEPAPVRARARTNAGWRQTIRRAERAIVRR